ncbi:DEAD/DEAH box helicase [Desulfoluna sp.]|uniref:DEAD/DEAH box helicase n=1 Tax=Desulfoluna sp. TaxID=2045199 RepID=UPI0026152802|nr:DEAD/DEAH box helicase [Desulfoluna sp.]
MSFDQLGLRAELLKAIKSKGYDAPTPIQERAIPVILGGQDILARAQTGTGKTDAFALPLVEILSRQKGNGRHPRALVLAPTRELALQVGESIKGYARRASLRCTVVHGGVGIHPQIDRLKRGVDILVATPGRLIDLAMHRHLKLSSIEFLVFDEADRMLDLGFSNEISEIISIMPQERRTMLFSATYTPEIRELAGKMLQDPAFIEVTPQNTAAESVDQKVHMVEKSNKRSLLVHLITRGRWSRVLVFCRTKHGANKLRERLIDHGISSAALHGNMSQSVRSRTLQEFKDGEIGVLVATDVAARGLDISQLPYVVNYDVPTMPEDYVHRIGRTGRAGDRGVAITLVGAEEMDHFEAIEALLKQKIPVEKVTGFTQGHEVPDFVLYRPTSTRNNKKVDKDLKNIVDTRITAKQEAKARKSKSGGASKGDRSKAKSSFDSDRRNDSAGEKSSRSGSRSSQGPKAGGGRRNDSAGENASRSGSRSSQGPKAGGGRRNDSAGENASRSGSRSSQGPKAGGGRRNDSTGENASRPWGRSSQGPKSGGGKRNDSAGKKSSRPGARSSQGAKSGKPRGRR